MRTAFREAKEWIQRKTGFYGQRKCFCVQFFEKSFLEDLYRVIEEEEFPCKNLVIELTESFAVKNIEILQEKFNDMRSREHSNRAG